MAALLAPKYKAEFTAAIASRTPLSQEELSVHTVDRLKEIWRLVKPNKPMAVLPPNWKKFDLQGLKDLYQDVCLPFYERENDGHWTRYRKTQLVTELEVYQEDRRAEIEAGNELTPVESSSPLCPKCQIPMLTRTNRLNKEEFFGCYRFPSCKATLPIKYDNKSTKEVQLQMTKQAELDGKAKVVKTEIIPKVNKTRKRPEGGYSAASDGSWAHAQIVTDSDEDAKEKRFNVNLTEEEMLKVESQRAQAAMKNK